MTNDDRDGELQRSIFEKTNWLTLRETVMSPDASPEAMQACRDFYLQYLKPVRILLASRWCEASEAEQIAHDLLTDLLKKDKISKLEPRPETKFRCWLKKAVKHYMIDRHRAEERREAREVMTSDGDECELNLPPSPDDAAKHDRAYERHYARSTFSAVYKRCVEAWLARLGPQPFGAKQIVIWMSDKNYTQMAEMLGISPDAARRRMERWRLEFWAEFEEHVARTVPEGMVREEISVLCNTLGIATPELVTKTSAA